MQRYYAILLFIGLSLSTFTGCFGPQGLATSPTNPTNPVSILFLIAPPSSVAINASVTVSAAVVNGSANAVVSWSLSCASAGACGSLAAGMTANQQDNTYTAPAAIPSGGTVTITATLQGDAAQTISATITITPPQPISLSFVFPPPASLQVNASANFDVKVANDISQNPQVNWTVTCASAPCGSFNPTTTVTLNSTTFTAPASVPSGSSVTVTAASVTDPTKTISATVAITATAPTLANGTYVFQLSSPRGTQANFVAGVIVAQNGAITNGEQDFISYAVDQNDEQYMPIFSTGLSGSYATTPDGDLQFTVQTGNFNIGASNNGVEIFNGVMVSSSRMLLTQVDGTIATGTLELQSSTAAPSGGYAFSTYGFDDFGQAAGIGGVLNVDSPGGISGAHSVVDVNDGFAFSGTQSLAASTVSAPDQFGRVVFQLNLAPASVLHSFDLAGYVVDSSHLRLIETNGDSFAGVMAGMALSQGANAGNFSASSIAGQTYVFGAAGYAEVPLQVAGVFTANADGTLTGTLNWNNQTVSGVQSPTAFTGSYTVDPTGRVTLSNISGGSAFTYGWEFYLSGSGEGLLLSNENQNMTSGRGVLQQTGAFSASSLSGSYAISAGETGQNSSALGANAVIGSITSTPASGSDTLAGFLDFGNGAADSPFSGSFIAASNGIFTGTITGLNTGSYTTQNNFTLYLIDNTRGLLIETDSSQLTLGELELQQ